MLISSGEFGAYSNKDKFDVILRDFVIPDCRRGDALVRIRGVGAFSSVGLPHREKKTMYVL